MSKHTKGPWVAIPFHTRDWDFNASKPLFDDGLWAILPESDIERLPIAVVDHADDHDPPTRKKAEKDARLIAAAPLVLGELKKCLAWMEDSIESHEEAGEALVDSHGNFHRAMEAEGKEIRQDVIAAIAAAEGRDA